MVENNYKNVKKVLWTILFANFLVAAMKIFVGFACKSQSVIADGIHSFSDGASNIVGLIGIRLASKPKDEKHPYGHSKFEILASLFIGIMLAFMSIKIISRAISAFKNPVVLDIDITGSILLIITICLNIIVAITEFRLGKKLRSTILVTDSLHTRGDIFISCVVLVGLLAIKIGIPVWVDTAMSIAVAMAVLVSAWQIIKNCIDVLVDSAVVNNDEVKKIIMTVPGVYDVHQVRSRGGMSQVFIDLHILIKPNENVTYGHNLSHQLEQVLKEHFGANTEVNIHVEPNDGVHNE